MNRNSKNWICIAHNYTEAGFASMSFYLSDFLAKNGYNVLFISHQPKFEVPLKISRSKGEIHVYSWPSKNRPSDLRSFFWFAKIFRIYRPSTVIGHFAGTNITAIVSKILSLGKTRTLIYYHTLSKQIRLDKRDNKWQSFLNIRKKFFYRLFCDTIICPSLLAMRDFNQNFIREGIGTRCEIILNPLSDRYSDGRERITNSENIIISYLGRLEPSKGVLQLVDSFLKFEQKTKTKIMLQIAGGGSLCNEIKERVDKSSNCKYFGSLRYNMVDSYIRESDYVIIPSLFDNLPTVGIESLMNGVPLLLSNKTGLAEMIQDSKSTLLFDPDETGLFKAFKWAEENISNSEKLENAARETYLEKFTLESYFNNILELLNKELMNHTDSKTY